MREILFRGKRSCNGEWEYGSLILWNDGDAEICITSSEEHEEQSKVLVYPETVGQYTGLTDKNGTKIFEGDIVAQNWYDHDEPTDDSFGEVVFCEYDCSFSVMDVEKDGIVPLGRCHAYHWEAEVIGNVHDKAWLLRK
jgi:uncharacterized phage protein (TIGR01671 family)